MEVLQSISEVVDKSLSGRAASSIRPFSTCLAILGDLHMSPSITSSGTVRAKWHRIAPRLAEPLGALKLLSALMFITYRVRTLPARAGI
jgi:hypothetical protein